MSNFYANITIKGPSPQDVLVWLKELGVISYFAPGPRDTAVVFHENLSSQEQLAAQLSARLACPALLVMGYGQSVLLYHLYEKGTQTDAYVSTPHADLELDAPAPPGDPVILCAAFGAERFEKRVASILNKEAKPGQPYEYAINRHGELARALSLPLFAAGAAYSTIDMGELPDGGGFDAGQMCKSA